MSLFQTSASIATKRCGRVLQVRDRSCPWSRASCARMKFAAVLVASSSLPSSAPVVVEPGEVARPVELLRRRTARARAWPRARAIFCARAREDVPVGLGSRRAGRAPCRRDGCSEWQSVRVEVGLLVVAGRRQHHVAVERGRVHAVVDVDDQVEVLPQRAQDLLVALGLVQVVGAPDDQRARLARQVVQRSASASPSRSSARAASSRS